MSITDLIQALEQNPDLEASSATIVPFVDGPGFFDEFLRARSGRISFFKKKLYNTKGSLLDVIEQKREDFQNFIESRYRTLDDVYAFKPLAKALGVANRRGNIARALVKHEFLSPDMPEGAAISNGRIISLYLDEKIVGKKKAERNLKRYVQSNYVTLDDIGDNKALSVVLRVSRNPDDIARGCLDRGFLSPKLPRGHPISKKTGCRYLDKTMVGPGQVKENVMAYVNYTYETLDDISMNRALSSVLNLLDANQTTLARALVKRGFLSPELPIGHIPKRKKGSFYFKVGVVGEEQAERNLKIYMQFKYATLDDIDINKGISTALGVPPYSTKATAKACVERGFLSAEIPDNHTLSKWSYLSFYINPEVVSSEQIHANLRKYVQYTYASINDVKRNKALAVALGIKDTRAVLRAKLIELGWLASDDFRGTYSSSRLPEQFGIKETEKRKGRRIREISARIEHKSPNTTTFVKGEAFEQLVGLFLAYTSPTDLVIPQYCLDVGKGYFRTRIDFRVGNDIYEVKWGHATDNINQTVAKHQRLLRKHPELNYHLIRLEESGEHINYPYEMYGALCDDFDGPEPLSFLVLAAMLMDSAGKEKDISEVKFLTHIRDFLYCKIDETNNKTGNERQEHIRGVLGGLCSFADRGALEAYLVDNTPRHFSSREAHFEYDGRLYRAFINPKQLQREEPHKYETTYYFGSIEFTKELNRNIAVLLECSSHVRRVESTLNKPKQRQHEPSFRILSVGNISTHNIPGTERVASLKAVKEILGIPDRMYRFALGYIRENGLNC